MREHLARLRFFITAKHSEEQLRHTAAVLAEELHALSPSYLSQPSPPGRSSLIAPFSAASMIEAT